MARNFAISNRSSALPRATIGKFIGTRNEFRMYTVYGFSPTRPKEHAKKEPDICVQYVVLVCTAAYKHHWGKKQYGVKTTSEGKWKPRRTSKFHNHLPRGKDNGRT